MDVNNAVYGIGYIMILPELMTKVALKVRETELVIGVVSVDEPNRTIA